MNREGVAGGERQEATLNSALTRVFEELTPSPLGVLAFGEWVHAPDEHREGAPRPVCVVVADFQRETMRPLGAQLRQLWLRAHVEPMFVLAADIARIADAFPIKVLELRDRSRVLLGTNPFVGIEVDREHVRLRLEQETRNHLLRMRRQWIMSHDDPRQLAQALSRSCTILDQQLSALWMLRQPSRLTFANLPSRSEAASSIAAALNWDANVFGQLSEFRRGGEVSNLEELFFRHLELIQKVADGVDQLGAAP